VQLNPSFEPGDTVDELVAAGVLAEGCRRIFRRNKDANGLGDSLRLHRHQQDAIDVARTGGSYVLTTGTGSGKSLAYFIPIVDHVLRHGSRKGIKAIVIYPMNALCNSQLQELEKYLTAGFGPGGEPVTYARYTGQESQEERAAIAANPPDILLTNFMMLELLLTRTEPNDRQVIKAAAGHTAPLMLIAGSEPHKLAALLANMNSLVLDYAARQKVGGTHLTYGYLRQLPVLPPDRYTAADLDFIVPRVLELVYTAWDMQPFARDLGYQGPPFAWDEQRRALLRAELDACYARLYGLNRKQLRYILDPAELTDRELADILDPWEDQPEAPRTTTFPGETFRVLKQREIKQYGEYRTRRLVLEAWDRLAGETLQTSLAAPLR
jgi:hypothetical protein